MAEHFRDIVESILGDKSEEFAEWAFGPNFKSISQTEIWKNWNELHGDCLMLCGSGKPSDDIPSMIVVWRIFS
jgi:hypothetical protein